MSREKSLPSAEREFGRGFGWTLLFSLAAHVLAIAALVLAPGFVLRPQPQLRSYTVDLVDASKLGGTNLVAGAKGKAPQPPKIEPAKARAPEPPPQPLQEAEPEPPPPEPPRPAEKPEPPPPPQKPEAAKAEPRPADEEAVALAKKAEPTPPRAQEVAKVEAPTAAPTVAAKIVAKIEPTAVKAEPTRPKPTIAKVQATPTTQVKPAVKESPGKSPPQGQNDSKARDERIAAAIKRVEQQAGTRGGGSGNGPGNAPGGPISLGPGEGAGGEVRSLATIMYTNRIQAMVKEKWAWAGTKSLKADIFFSILPNGEVNNVRTVVSSGDPTYDKLAETAVRAASPFPAPPEECQEEFETSGFLYTFEPE